MSSFHHLLSTSTLSSPLPSTLSPAINLPSEEQCFLQLFLSKSFLTLSPLSSLPLSPALSHTLSTTQLATIYTSCDKPSIRRAMFSATFSFHVEQWCKINLDNVVQVSSITYYYFIFIILIMHIVFNTFKTLFYKFIKL